VYDVVIHNNYYNYCAPIDVWRANTKAFYRRFLEETDGCNVRFHLENTLELDGELMAEIIDYIHSPRLDMCLDVGHVQGMAHSKMTPQEWIEHYGPIIGYAHLHNNYGQSDEHNNLTDGIIPMEQVLAALEINAPSAIWCLECGRCIADIRTSLDYLVALQYLSGSITGKES
jgi:sugar phosphate isomerase/epimerase